MTGNTVKMGLSVTKSVTGSSEQGADDVLHYLSILCSYTFRGSALQSGKDGVAGPPKGGRHPPCAWQFFSWQICILPVPVSAKQLLQAAAATGAAVY